MITWRQTPEERRELVARGLRAGKSNRAIAKELDVDEGTVRRDRKYLETPIHERPVKKERPMKSKKIIPAYNPDNAENLELHARRILKALKLWVAEECIVQNELDYVLHEAGKHLYQGRSSIQHYPVPTAPPTQLLPVACPDKSKWGDLIPNPDYWAEWLARWLALCLPRQEELQKRVLQETSLWARS